MGLRLKAFVSFALFAILLGGIAAPYTTAVQASGTASTLFTPEQTCAGYVDVPSSHVEYCQALIDLKATGAASGYPDGFRINERVTRQQFAKMIVVHFGGALVDPNTTPQHFADVPRTNPFFQWIETALQRGWMSGVQGDPSFLNDCVSPAVYEDPTKAYFRPCKDITRQQMAKMTAQAGGFQDNISFRTPTFSDMPANAPQFPYVERLVMHQATWKPYLLPGASACASTTKPCYFPTQAVSRLDAAFHIWLARVHSVGLARVGQAFTLRAFNYNLDGVEAYAEAPTAMPAIYTPPGAPTEYGQIQVPVASATTRNLHFIESGPVKGYFGPQNSVKIFPYGSSDNFVVGERTFDWDPTIELAAGTRYRFRNYHAGGGIWWSEFETSPNVWKRATTSKNMGTGTFREATIGAETSDELYVDSGRVTITEAKYHTVGGAWTGFCWDPTHVQRLTFQSYSRVGTCNPFPVNGLPSYSWYVEYKR